jgi:hypothetical protein
LFGIETKIPQKLKSRLKGSWAEVFRLEVLPILMRSEEDFADLYGITEVRGQALRLAAFSLIRLVCPLLSSLRRDLSASETKTASSVVLRVGIKRTPIFLANQ